MSASQWRSATTNGAASAAPVVKPHIAAAPVDRWQPFANVPVAKPNFHQDSQVRTVAWEEVSDDAARSIITRRETAGSDPFDLPGNQDSVVADPFDEPVTEDESTAVDPFEVDLPSYEPAEDSVETQDSASPIEELRDSFEDAFDEPTPESMREELEAELPTGESDAERILQESQDSLNKELMRDELEQGASDPFDDPSRDDAADSDDSDSADSEEEIIQFGPRAGSRFTEEIPNRIEPDDAKLQERREELAKERAENDVKCREEFTRLRSDTIDQVELSIRIDGEAGQDFPLECGLGDELFSSRSWPEITYMWKASGLCHKPLYFEQVQLERYGHSWGPYLQPVMSGVHFFGTVPVLPYKMGIRTPNECVYTLGYYRPGSCAPYMIDPVPFTWRAAFFQGMTTAGAVIALP